MLFYIICGFMTATVAGVLLHPVRKRKTRLAADRGYSFAMMVLLPVAAAALYARLGHPDVPSAPAQYRDDQKDVARRQVMMLAEKPVEVIAETGGTDPGAFAVMAELNLRLGSRENAERFMKQAVDAAEKSGDLNLDIYKKRLKDIGR